MGIRIVVAMTDSDWFEELRHRPELVEVNFWAPSGRNFRALQPGELFLFKLHAPRNMIVGGGVFTYANVLPWTLAWQAFGSANGARTAAEMRERIVKYRRVNRNEKTEFEIGCRVLTSPFFLDEKDWIPVPKSWSPNIVSTKVYDTDTSEGLALWEAVTRRLQPGMPVAESERYGRPHLIRPRLGQGTFRIAVTDAYQRRCAVSGERTLPALDAAHIKPFGEGGQHAESNGLLLRKDIHSLFDAGYVTVTRDLRFEVSQRIKEEFENGRHYYELHGTSIALPSKRFLVPSQESLAWHNEHCYRG